LLAAASAAAEEIPYRWSGVKRVVAVGDIHGDLDAFLTVLRMAGVVNEDRDWVAGTAHLVQIGDVPARGPQTRKALDYLMKIEQQAAAAGGRVHALIGNHDAMAIYGDLRWTLPEEYAEFRSSASEQLLREEFEKELALLKRHGRAPASPTEQEAFAKRWFEMRPPGWVEHRRAFAFTGRYGVWIRSHNAMITIDNTLFLHGGISPAFAGLSAKEANETIRRELATPDKIPPGLTTDVDGPLWYRGFAEGDEAELGKHLASVLSFHGVSRVIIGHTVTRTTVVPRFGSRVINIDVGLSRFYGAPPACLAIVDDVPVTIHRGTRFPIPGPTPDSLQRYFHSIGEATHDLPAAP
jgi:Calcineurin-like phosphoesterase